MLRSDGLQCVLLLIFVAVVGAQNSHVHTTLNNDVTTQGFSFSYRVSNPEVGKKLYWIIVPESIRKLSLEDIMSGTHEVKGDRCKGVEQETDEVKHTVKVRCDFAAGNTYRFYISLDDDRNIHEDGVAFDVPAAKPISQPKQDKPKITTTNFVLTMSEPAMTHAGYTGLSTTKSAFHLHLSHRPTLKPTIKPSFKPTFMPTSSHPTLKPSFVPSFFPTPKPTFIPTFWPTPDPSFLPTPNPTSTAAPTFLPTLKPSLKPSMLPTFPPSLKPSVKPTFKPTFSPTHWPTTTTGSPTNVPVTTQPTAKLDIGDKVEVQQRGKEEPQMGCIMALPEGAGNGQWTVALEDSKAGTYLFHMPKDAPPKLVESAGCLLDMMGDDDESSNSPPPASRRESETSTTTSQVLTSLPEVVSTTTTSSEPLITTKREFLVRIHPILPSDDIASDALSKVSQIRNEMQAKVDQLKAELQNKSVHVKLEQEKPDLALAEAPATPMEPLPHSFPSFSEFTHPLQSKPSPLDDALKKFSHPVDGEFAVSEDTPYEHAEVASANQNTEMILSLAFTAVACLAAVMLSALLIRVFVFNAKGDELNLSLLEDGLIEEDF